MAEHSLLEEQHAQPSISESFSAFSKHSADSSSDPNPDLNSDLNADLEVPELTAAGPETETEPTPDSLAADLNDLDLLLPEEPSAEEIVLEEETPSDSDVEPVAADEIEDPVAAQSGPDDVLRDIYSRETANHVATVRSYLDREEGVSEPHAIPEEVYRACHTLSGSSKMAQARHGIRLAEPLDHWLRRVFNSGLGLLNQDLSLLSDCMLAMEAVVTYLDEVTGYFQNHHVLMNRIAQAEKILDHRIAQATEEQADTSLSGDEDELSEDAGEFDPEVASIFCEEAMELIEASESSLSDWRLEPNSADYRSALKRPLHTLKGGARMAGISAMGDLSHELETLVMQVDNGSVPTDDAVFDVIQASLDELARMRESVANGRRVSSARQMIARIHSLSKPRGAAGAAPAAAAPTASPAAPKGEPFRRTVTPGPASAQPPAVPPTPQSFAPPSPTLTPAEQETPAAAASESPADALAEFGDSADAEPASAEDGPAGIELRFNDPEAAADFEAARAEIAAADTEASDVESSGAKAGLSGTDLPSDAETQLNRALPPSLASLPDTLVAPMPDFEPAPNVEPVAGVEPPHSANLAAKRRGSPLPRCRRARFEHSASSWPPSK